MNIADTIRKRRSVFPKQYSTETISKEELLSALELANYAPSHRMVEPYRFIVFQKESIPTLLELLNDSLAEIPALKKSKTITKLEHSNAIIFIIQKNSDIVPKWENTASMAMAVQNIWLGFADKNIGCYWSTPPWAIQLHKQLGLQENEECRGLLYVGKTDDYPTDSHPMRSDFEGKVEWR